MRIIALLLGLLFGSLGSVLLIRLSEKVDKETIKGILRGRSVCPKCGTKLKARNLIPLVSFLRQGGKCEHCKQRISSLYPILEMGSAIIFVVSFLVFHNIGTGAIVFWCLVNRLLFLLIVYDVMKYELHVPIRILLAILIAVPQFFGRGDIAQATASAAFFVMVFYLIYWGSKRYMRRKYGMMQEGFGEGDVYLSGAIGLLVPFILNRHLISFGRNSLVATYLLFLILSCLLGIFFRLCIYVTKRRTPHMWINTVSPLFRDKILIPFIPAMIVAFWLLMRKADFFISLFSPLG